MDIMLPVLRDYLGGAHKSMSAMDIACAPSIRVTFQTILQHPYFLLGDFGASNKTHIAGYLKWLSERHVQFRQLRLRMCTIVTQAATLDEHMLQKVEIIDIEESSDQLRSKLEDAYYQVLRKCVAVQRVFSEGPFCMIDQLIATFERCSHLPVRSISGVLSRTDYAAERLGVLFQNTLEEVYWPCLVTDEPILMTALTTCKRLRKVSLPLQDLTADDIIALIEGLPLLTELHFWREAEHFHFSTDLTVDEMNMLAPRFRKLRKISFCCGLSGLGAKFFPIIMAGCPDIEELLLTSLTYSRVREGGIDGYSLATKWFDNAHASEDAIACIQACRAVPIVSLAVNVFTMTTAAIKVLTDLIGPTVRDLDWNVSELSSQVGLTYLSTHCPEIRSLRWCNFDKKVLIEALMLSFATNCPYLRDLTIVSVITDVGMVRMLEQCGGRLTKLNLGNSTKTTSVTLKAIMTHCINLQELMLVRTGIKVEDIINTVLLPDHFKDLRKLRLNLPMCKKIAQVKNLASRWTKIVSKIE